MKPLRHAFTMVELLFVIVILGIIGGIALETIRQYYEGIYRTQTYTQRISEADHILDQLTKYFENAIDMSIVNMDIDAADGALAGTCVGELSPEAENVAHDYTTAFIGVDIDSLHSGGSRPGWSETVRPNPFLGTTLISNDANFTAANAAITALDPTSNLQNSAIYNVDASYVDTCTHFFANNGNAYYEIPVGGVNYGTNTLTLTDNFVASGNAYSSGPSADKKFLLRTGYAFRVLNTGEFVMFSNFRPWQGALYTTGTRSTLGENVASFYADFNNTNYFNTRGTLWRLKVCMRGLDTNLSSSGTAAQEICRERKVHVRY
jgi:prepilin-type N-terminal cleavage/methylation domain-containing protein